jgi:hypothetical protein
MRRMMILSVFGLVTLLAAGALMGGVAGERQPAVLPWRGQVKAIVIHTCGLQPGGCHGVLVRATDEGEEISVAIMPPLRIERGAQVVPIDAIAVGDYVRVQGP